MKASDTTNNNVTSSSIVWERTLGRKIALANFEMQAFVNYCDNRLFHILFYYSKIIAW